MTRHIKRGGKIWIRIFPDKPITGKPLEVRQGKGVTLSIAAWIQPGRVLYEVEGVSESWRVRHLHLRLRSSRSDNHLLSDR